MICLTFRRQLLAATALAMGAPIAAYAADAAPAAAAPEAVAEGDGLNEITVTAQKRPENLQIGRASCRERV